MFSGLLVHLPPVYPKTTQDEIPLVDSWNYYRQAIVVCGLSLPTTRSSKPHEKAHDSSVVSQPCLASNGGPPQHVRRGTGIPPHTNPTNRLTNDSVSTK